MVAAPLPDLSYEGGGEEVGAKTVERVAGGRSFRADVVPEGGIILHGRVAELFFEPLVEGWCPGAPVEPMHGGLVEESHLDDIPEVVFEMSIELAADERQVNIHGFFVEIIDE